MKRINAFLILVLFVFTLAGCSSGVSGTYYNSKNSKEYLELKTNNTFFLKQSGGDYAGNYKVDGKEIQLVLPGGMADSVEIKNNKTVVDHEGVVWSKK